MANYETLKSSIQDVIKQNGSNDITGALMQQSLLAMISSLGANYQYAGIAKLTPSQTDPGTPDQNVFYIVSEPGTYSNFGNIVIANTEIAILKYNGAWSKEAIGITNPNFMLPGLTLALNSVQGALNGNGMRFISASKLLLPAPTQMSYWRTTLTPIVLSKTTQVVLDFLDSGNYINAGSVWDGQTRLFAQVLYSGSTSYKIIRYDEESYEHSSFSPVCQVVLTPDGSKIVRDYVPMRNASDIVDTQNIRAVRSFSSRDILVANSLTEMTGVIYEDGTVRQTAGWGICAPIPIPDSVKYILFAYDDFGGSPNYVNCYTNNDFTGFLGRSDNMAWRSLYVGPGQLFVAMELQPGTKYISFMTKNNTAGQLVSLQPNIYGSATASVGTMYNDVFVPTDAMDGKIGEPSTTIHFSVKANCHIADSDSDTTSLQDAQELYEDYGVLMLPDDYTKNGKPTRLIIGCHGAGGDVSVDDSQTERAIEYQYMVANGFAVMDMSGLPEAWADLMGINRLNNIGSPIAMECYIKGYEFVVKHFNICPDGVLVSGGSMGGISASNLVLSGMIPVIAQGVNCPVLDAYNQIFLHPWSGGLPKTAMGIIYGFEQVGGQYVYDESKVCGYNAIVFKMQSFDENGNRVTSVGTFDFSTKKLNGQSVVEYKDYPCPLKIWHCDNDTVVNPAVSERLITAIRNAGGQAWLRRIPTGGHGPLTVGDVLTNPSGSNIYRGNLLQIKPIVEEEFLFFKRFADVSPSMDGWTIISNAQTSLEANYYYGPSGLANVPGITGVQPIEIPDGITLIKFVTSSDWTENQSVVCFDSSNNIIGVAGVSSPFGGAETLGSQEYELPAGTTSISYIYQNDYGANDQHMGLAVRILGK